MYNPLRANRIMAYFSDEVMECLERLKEIDQRSKSWIVNQAVVEYCKKRKMELMPSKKGEQRREA